MEHLNGIAGVTLASRVGSASELCTLTIVTVITVLLQAVGLTLSDLMSRLSASSVATTTDIAQLVMLLVIDYTVAADGALV